MSQKRFCDKCHKEITTKQITVVDSQGLTNFDLCFDCFGLFGEWLEVMT